jgi:hypothetical protein
MRREKLVSAVLLLAATGVCWAGNYVVPTTTVAALTSNNTSAANGFAKQSNGNQGAGNVSKADIHSLLYSGNTTKVYAHLMVWFGGSNHMNVGYSSTDAGQVTRQINDMISRGINGVIIDWYGPDSSTDQAARFVMAEAEKHPGFTFAIMVDQGAIKWDSCRGCTPQQALVSQLQYIEQKYFASPAYMTQGGQPVVTNFDIDQVYAIDWNAVNASLGAKPAFLFQNNDGFSHSLSSGSYSWVMPTTSDYGISYLSSFYQAGMSHPSEHTAGAAYKGFNDTMAGWGSGRIMKQQCGQTWLKTFSEINALYNGGKQLPFLQLVTWNDYEEGTEIESGIDNCFSLSTSVSGKSLQWTISGDESTIDYYRVYISTDGKNLMPLIDNAVGLRSVDLCSFPIPAGTYKLLVQAVGKPTLSSQITGAVSYSPACGGSSSGGLGGSGSGTPTLSFAAAPASVNISAGKSGSFTITATPQSGSFDNPITLSCPSLPSALSCSFAPANIIPGALAAASTLTISAASVTSLNLHHRNWNALYASAVLPFGITGLALIGNVQRRRTMKSLILICMLGGISLLTVSCGGKTFAPQSAALPGSSYSVTVHGNSISGLVSATVTVNVQ